MQAFLLLLANLFLYGLMGVGVAVVSAYLYAYLKHVLCPCGRHNGLVAAGLTTAGVLFSLWLLPQAWLMDIPLLNLLPMLIYTVYFVSGLVHLCIWRRQLLSYLSEYAGKVTGCCVTPVEPDCGCAPDCACTCVRRDPEPPCAGS